jgi:DNA polymerase-2
MVESCLSRAELCRELLMMTGLIELSVRRSVLTGTLLDTAWTSIASFETFYARALRKNGIIEPPARTARLSGSAGGTIFEPQATLRDAVMVFDYRSLYPSVIATFCIDPLTHMEAEEAPDDRCIIAPNGARFARGQGILPSFIARCFAERIAAVDGGDAVGAHVLKILMNSLYGVLASDGCRYARSEIAGAVTGFGTWCLEAARDWFEAQGYRVLYGDTDSIFLQTGLPFNASHSDFAQSGHRLAHDFNHYLVHVIRERWQVESFVQLRFDKAYRRFLIPPARMMKRSSDAVRGRVKGYAGLEVRPDGVDVLDIKGMEAIRSDAPPLVRRVQRELLTMVFTGRTDSIPTFLSVLKGDLLGGRLDDELVYTRKYRRTPPRLGSSSLSPHTIDHVTTEWESQRISYVWTAGGPHPIGRHPYKLDYRHYLTNQILPLARGIGVLAGFDPDDILGSGQMELFTS